MLYKVTTKYGVLAIQPSSLNVIGVETAGLPDLRGLFIHGVEYGVTATLRLSNTGTWQVHARNNVSMYKINRKKPDLRNDSPTREALATLLVEVESIVNKWAKSNQQAILEAEVAYRLRLLECSTATSRLVQEHLNDVMKAEERARVDWYKAAQAALSSQQSK